MKRRVSVDTNLLLLLIVGLVDDRYISQHKRCRSYDRDSFLLLKNYISDFEEIVVTPNTLTETSNLLGHINEPARRTLFSFFQSFIAGTEEDHVPSGVASQHPEFLRLGLADAVLLNADKGGVILLTDDLDLYLSAARQGFEVINFSHLRERAL